MNKMLWFFALSMVFIPLCINSVCAYEECNTRFENVTLVCKDSLSTIGYCCETRNETVNECCFHSHIWALWYFWCGMIILLLFLSCCVVGSLKLCSSDGTRVSSSNERQTRTSEINMHAMESDDLPCYATETMKSNNEDNLPTYEEIKAQGIAEQFARYSSQNNPALSADASSINLPSNNETTQTIVDTNIDAELQVNK